MANPSPKPRKALHDISPRMRSTFWEALCKLAEENGHSVSDELAEWIKETPPAHRPKWFSSMAAFRPRERSPVKGQIDVNHTHKRELPAIQDAAQRFLAQLAPRPAIDGDIIEGTCETGPLLPSDKSPGEEGPG